MKYLMKLNVVSIIYALIILLILEFMINVNRFSRLTGWDMNTVTTIISIIIIIGVILGTIMAFRLTIKWMKFRKANFWTIILWVPYFIFFVFLIATLFPSTSSGDIPNPIVGLVSIGVLLVFPVYIIIINFLVLKSSDKIIKT